MIICTLSKFNQGLTTAKTISTIVLMQSYFVKLWMVQADGFLKGIDTQK